MLKALLKHPLTLTVLAFLISAYGRLVFATSRKVWVTPVPAEVTRGPVFFALWHQHIFAIPLLTAACPAPLMGLMSASRDGQLTQRIARRYGITAAVGSSHRGGATAARHLIRATRGQGAHALFLTPDGPRGPAHVAKPGATEIARLTRLPLIPLAAAYSRAISFNSWDTFCLPLPFTTFYLAAAAPLAELTPAALTASLHTLTTQAHAAARSRQTPQPRLG